MRGYYAFNWRRYDHSVHPMTAAAIIETGFLTNARDRNVIVKDPQKAAQGIAGGILKFLKTTVQAGDQNR
jgi:N-acetylmuramoyl-L-alanine amidase